MSFDEIKIMPLDGKGATQAEYEALNRHNNHIRKERLPDDLPIPLEESIKNLQSMPPFVDLRFWAGWTPGQTEIVGLANVLILRTEDNQHLVQFDITVLPAYRRQGLGRKFLALIAEAVQQDQRRLLMTSTVDRIPGGEAFMRRIGAKKGLEGHTNQLDITELPQGLVQEWLVRGQTNLADFELGFWDGPYPEEHIQEVCELYDLTNQQPLGELEVEDMKLTAEQIRLAEANLFARGNLRWTFYLIDRASDKFAGYTETVWNPNRPEILRQVMTGVFPQYRNRGLGHWLKAAMLDRVMRDRPQVRYVRTGNADTNDAMLKINNELGFKPYMADALWQIEIEKVMDYLKSSEA